MGREGWTVGGKCKWYLKTGSEGGKENWEVKLGSEDGK
jgi:hypothetical protein